MYAAVSQLQTVPVISLQTGTTVGWITQPIISSEKLEVVAFKCDAQGFKSPAIIMMNDVRQLAADSLIVNSEDDLTNPSDLVRFNTMLKASFDPIGKHVVSDAGRHLGSVDDYNINLDSARVQKLHVRQPLIKAWFSPGLIIDRTQIIDVSAHQITVRDTALKAGLMPTGPIPENIT